MATSPAPSQVAAQNAVKLAPGQSVHYDPTRPAGQRYYAAAKVAPAAGTPFNPAMPTSEHGQGGGFLPQRPIAPPATPPPPPQRPVAPYGGMGALTPAQIDARASALAQSQLTPQQAAIQQQQSQSDAEAKAQEDEITQFTTAEGNMLGQMPGQVSDAYNKAAQETGQLGEGIGGQVGSDLAAAQAANEQFAGGAPGSETIKAPDVATTVGMLQGVIPGSQLAAQGAAEASLAAAQPAVAVDAGREVLEQRMAQAKKDDDGYAQQLIQLAATYPGLKAQALTQLNQYELDKANYRQSVTMNQNTLKNDAATRADNLRSIQDQEKLSGIEATNKVDYQNAELNYKWAGLQLRNREDAVKAAQAGKIIDPAASKTVGYVVYKDGSYNKSIPVAKSTSASSNPATIKKTQAGYVQKAATYAARSLATWTKGGKPIQNKTVGPFTGAGTFVANPKYANIPPGKPGATFHTEWGTKQYPASGPRPSGDIATTNKGGRAQTTGAGGVTQQQATARLHAQVDAYLQAAGYTPAQINTWVTKQINAYYGG